MNKTSRLVLAAMGLATAALAHGQSSSVEIYGKVHVELNRTRTGPNSTLLLQDSASRIGFRGREDMGGGLHALFGLELPFAADSGLMSAPVRASYVGLQGGWGIVTLGRLDSGNPTGSPLYSQVQEIVAFAPNDSGATAFVTEILNARNRTSNSLGYASHEVKGWRFRARHYLRGAGTATEGESDAQSLDLGLSWRQGPLRLALGLAKDQRKGGLRANEFDDKWHLGARWDFGSVKVYAMGGTDRFQNTSTRRREVDFLLAGARYTKGQHEVTANVMRRDVQTSLTGVQRRTQLAYTYSLSRRTELQLYHDNDGVDSSRSNVRVRTLGTAVRHGF